MYSSRNIASDWYFGQYLAWLYFNLILMNTNASASLFIRLQLPVVCVSYHDYWASKPQSVIMNVGTTWSSAAASTTSTADSDRCGWRDHHPSYIPESELFLNCITTEIIVATKYTVNKLYLSARATTIASQSFAIVSGYATVGLQ